MGHHSSAKYPDIVRDPEVQGGDPSIIGTRIPVWVIVAAWRINPRMADRCRWYPMLTPDLIEEALAFADENRQEIEAALKANDVELG